MSLHANFSINSEYARLYVIGDIHGRADLLDQIVERIRDDVATHREIEYVTVIDASRLRTRSSPAVVANIGMSDWVIRPEAPSTKAWHVRRRHYVVIRRLLGADDVGILPMIAKAERRQVSPTECVFRTVGPNPRLSSLPSDKDDD